MPERQHPLRVFGGAGRCIACALLAVLPCADIARAQTAAPIPVATSLVSEADGTTTLSQSAVVSAPLAEVGRR